MSVPAEQLLEKQTQYIYTTKPIGYVYIYSSIRYRHPATHQPMNIPLVARLPPFSYHTPVYARNFKP